MVRTVDYETRRKAVLAATINKYIQDALPVASENIASEFNLSSATIRNILAELEDIGYLRHPYTSAGRIPTEKGYRYYVDFLISQMELLEEEKNCIIKEYKKQMSHLEDALEHTSEIISMVTRYTGIVSLLEWQDKLFYNGISHILEQPEFQNFEKIQILIRIIEDKQQLLDIINRDINERIKVYIGRELGYPEMASYSLVVSSFGFKDKSSGRLAVLGPMRMKYNHIIPALRYVSDLLTDLLDEINE